MTPSLLLAATLAVGPLATQPDDTDWQAQESRYLKNIRQLTSEDTARGGFIRAGEAYFSPDARRIIFQAVRGKNPFYQIYTLSLADAGSPLSALSPPGAPAPQIDRRRGEPIASASLVPLVGREPRLVSTGSGRTTCAFFRPDGKKIIFASSHLDPHVAATEEAERKKLAEEATDPTKRRRRYEWVFDEHMDIFEADPDGSNLRRLTDAPGYDAEGSYSPDGKQIVFCSTRGGDPDLYIMNADGSGVRQLVKAPGYDGGPFFSPDGKRVIFRSDRKEKDLLQIYVINADGTGERALTDNAGVNWCPYWHRDGRHIIYAFADYSKPDVRPNFDLFLMNVDDGKTERITFATAADVLPVFSPDGKKLMWTSARRGDTKDSQIFMADFVLDVESRAASEK